MMLKIEKTEVCGWEAAIRGMRNPMNSWEKSDSHPCAVLGEITDKNRSYRCAGCKNEFVGRPNCMVIGKNDLDLMIRLRNAGPEHAKFLRMVVVACDITAPLYWWKEFDTYKIGTVANSCSTMHKIMAKPFEIDDFSHEHLLDFSDTCKLMNELDMNIGSIESLNLDASLYRDSSNLWSPRFLLFKKVDALNQYRNLYLKVKDAPTKNLAKRNEILETIWWQVIQLLPSSYNQKRTVFLNYWVLANIYHQRQQHKMDEWRVTFCDWIKTLPYSEFITGEFEEESK